MTSPHASEQPMMTSSSDRQPSRLPWSPIRQYRIGASRLDPRISDTTLGLAGAFVSPGHATSFSVKWSARELAAISPRVSRVGPRRYACVYFSTRLRPHYRNRRPHHQGDVMPFDEQLIEAARSVRELEIRKALVHVAAVRDAAHIRRRTRLARLLARIARPRDVKRRPISHDSVDTHGPGPTRSAPTAATRATTSFCTDTRTATDPHPIKCSSPEFVGAVAVTDVAEHPPTTTFVAEVDEAAADPATAQA